MFIQFYQHSIGFEFKLAFSVFPVLTKGLRQILYMYLTCGRIHNKVTFNLSSEYYIIIYIYNILSFSIILFFVWISLPNCNKKMINFTSNILQLWFANLSIEDTGQRRCSPGLRLPSGHALSCPLGVWGQVVNQLAADLVGGLYRISLLWHTRIINGEIWIHTVLTHQLFLTAVMCSEV